MKNSLKKLMASATAVAIVTMNMASMTVNAAALNGATAVYDDGTDTITVTHATDFTLDNISVVSVKTSAGVDKGVTVADVTEADGSFAITNVLLNGLAADIYSVSFSTVGGDFGATVVYVGNDNVVNVSAVVLPILSMSLSANTLDFGELAIGTNNVNLNVTTASNAKDGIVVTVASTGLATGAAGTDYHIGSLQRTASVATTGTDSYQITSTTNAGGSVIAETAMLSSQAVLTASSVAESNAITNVNLDATIDAQTESGNYNDVLTFTATGTF